MQQFHCYQKHLLLVVLDHEVHKDLLILKVEALQNSDLQLQNHIILYATFNKHYSVLISIFPSLTSKYNFVDLLNSYLKQILATSRLKRKEFFVNHKKWIFSVFLPILGHKLGNHPYMLARYG